MTSPCYECICVPVCRGKIYSVAVWECEPLYYYLYKRDNELLMNRPKYIHTAQQLSTVDLIREYGPKKDFQARLLTVVRDLKPSWNRLGGRQSYNDKFQRAKCAK
ncbi:MAG: hypothetical protein ACTSW1_07695 [Candidatus Hodarchaeales archaeon]